MKKVFTEDSAKKSPSGGVLVGKREGQTIIHEKGTEGGYLVGKLHKEGGIEGINKATGQPIEVQGGEVIITAPAVADQTKREFDGEMLTNREILSRINEKGGGVSFADGGEMPNEIFYTGASYKFGGESLADYDIMRKLSECACEHEYNDGGKVVYYDERLRNLKNEIKSTYPKIPVAKLFPNELEVLPYEIISDADRYVEEPENLPAEYVNIEKIVPTQKYVTVQNLKSTKNVLPLPILFLYNGKYYVLDGHHRISNAILKNATKVKAFVYDYEKNNDGNNFKNGGSTLLAPNGNPSNLTPEQYKLVRTPEFKAWFGDWENDPANASKVVDENGEPQVCYHGTFSENLNNFDESKIGHNTGNEGHYGYGFYFSYSKVEASTYTSDRNPIILNCFLNIRNPFLSNNIDHLEKYAKDYGYYEEKKPVAIDSDWLESELKKRKDQKPYLLYKSIKDNGYEKGWALFLKKNNIDWDKETFDYNRIADWLEYDSSKEEFSKENEFKNDNNEIPEHILEDISEQLNVPVSKIKTIKQYTVGNYPRLLYMMDLGNRSRILTNEIKQDGFDGIIAGSEIVLFKSNQIKLADGTNTTFNTDNPHIRFNHGGVVGAEMVSTEYLNSIRTQDKSKYDLDLENSIEKIGIVESVTIGYWEEYDKVALLDGHHRLDSAIFLGIDKIPAKIVHMYDNPFGKIKLFDAKNTIFADESNTTFNADNSDIRYDAGGSIGDGVSLGYSLNVNTPLNIEYVDDDLDSFEEGGSVSKKFWGDVAGGVLFYCTKTKRFLLLHRSQYVYEPNTWGIVSGKLDDGENVEEAVKREAKEETGYEVSNLFSSYVFKNHNFAFYNFISFVDEEFVPVLNWENQDYKWVKLEEFPDNLHFGVKLLIENEDLKNIDKMKNNKSYKEIEDIVSLFNDGGEVITNEDNPTNNQVSTTKSGNMIADISRLGMDVYEMEKASDLQKKEMADLLILSKLLPSFNQSKFSLERATIIKEMNRLKRKIDNERFFKQNEMEKGTLFTPHGLLDYYYTQAIQLPTKKLDVACELPTPNGEKSKLPLIAYLNVRTPQFKNWFGDWEKAYETNNYVNCSTLVDEETKEPKIFYHGVRKYVPSFGNFSNMGEGVVRPYGSFEPPSTFPASYFAENEDYAKFYGGIAPNMPMPSQDYQPFIYKVFIKMKNPVDITPLGFNASYKDLIDYLAVAYGIVTKMNNSVLNLLRTDGTDAKPVWAFVRNDIGLLETIKDYGFDGLIQIGDVPVFLPNGEVETDRSKYIQEKEFLTFSPSQIKSATVKKSFYFEFFNDIRFKQGGYVRI